jgi:hypothetical protein
MDEGRKRVIGIIAAVRWAERIMRKVDNACGKCA